MTEPDVNYGLAVDAQGSRHRQPAHAVAEYCMETNPSYSCGVSMRAEWKY